MIIELIDVKWGVNMKRKPKNRQSTKHLIYLFIDNLFMIYGIYLISMNSWIAGILFLGISFAIFMFVMYDKVEGSKDEKFKN